MNKSDSNDTLEEVYLSNSSLLSESTNFSDDALNDKNIRIEEPTTTTNKRKGRLATAFRSFRRKKIESKPSEEYPGKSETPDSQRKSVKSDKKGSRASRLVKRLSMSGIRRTKKSTDNLKRETPEGATLSVSEISLLEIEADDTTSTVNTTTNKVPRKGDQLQITISGKKIERRSDAIGNPISDTKITEAEPSKPQRKPKKFNITVSDQDASPNVQAPPIPYSICGSDISVSSISTVEKISHTHSIEQSSISSTGVIKKSSFRKPNKRPLSMSSSKTGSLERGRRFPRPADDAKTDVATGSVSVDSASGSKTTDLPAKIGPQPKPTASQSVTPIEDKPKIAFETNMASTPEKREHLYKILVIGELGTGKTSFIKRYVHQFFSQNYRATIGVDFALKVLNWDNNTIIRLQLWDIAGQERFGNMTRVYYKEAVGAFIVFDVTRSATFDAVVKWKQDLDSKVQLPNGSPIPCILLANKCDQQKQGMAATPDKMNEYVKEHGFAGWFETSAKENVHIEEAARALVNKILLNDKLISTNDIGDPDKFGLEATSQQPKKNCSC
ncbi:uncharacterized protein LOC119074082 isoform X1 [Bradysia coprophila]|uniref:uncharacterized protein LOC119074082 isoform X1 n=2 Tax=Bradysia coprophila TaxID=38358 RepID=UPI00187D9AAD|nr:uncharacterized protein LOC119074082 isoform X1 [Bradysia coprophila]